MTAMKTMLTTAALVLGLSGAAFAQAAAPDSVGSNAAGSKSGVVGKGDAMERDGAMERSPATTGTATAPGSRMAPGARGMGTDDPSVAPKPTNPTPGAR